MQLEIISNQIIQRRAGLKMTQQMLSELSGASLRTIKTIEKGGNTYSIKSLGLISEALGMELTLSIKKMSQ